MNAHNPIDRSALILGALNLTESNRDPIAELRERTREEAYRLGETIELLMAALPAYRKTVANRAITGTFTTADDEARLAVLVAFNDIEYSDDIEAIIADLARDLGIDEDQDDLFADAADRASYIARIW